MEIKAYQADGSELIKDVPLSIAQAIGYFSTNRPHPILDPDGERPAIDTRPYQLDAIVELEVERQRGHEALLHLATGLGKTTVGAMTMLAFANRDNGPDNPLTDSYLWLTHTLKLATQARKKFQELFPGIPVGELTGKRKDELGVFTFATLQTMQGIKERYGRRMFKYISVDEGHHGPADTFEDTISYFTPDFLMGLTGTPFRNDNKDLEQLFGRIAYSMGLAEGIVEGWLTPIDYRMQRDHIVRKLGTGRLSAQTAQKRLGSRERDISVAEVILKTQAEENNAKTLVFCRSVQHVQAMVELLPGSVGLHSMLPDKQKDKIWDDFSEGDVQILVTVDMANEGVDLPKLKIGAFCRQTRTETVFFQQLGRGVRPDKGKESFIGLDFVGNADRIFALHRLMEEIKQAYKKRYSKPHSSAEEAEDLERRASAYVRNMGFVFTPKEVDIIQRVQDLENAPAPPPGWLTRPRMEKIFDLGQHVLNNVIKDLRLVGTIMRRPKASFPALYYSPLEQGYIALALQYNRLFETWHTISELADQSGMTDYSTRHRLRALGIVPRPLRIGAAVLLVSPEDGKAFLQKQDALQDALVTYPMTKTEIGRRAGVSAYHVNKAMDSLEIRLIRHEAAAGNEVGRFSVEDSGLLLKYLEANKPAKLDPAPPGWRLLVEVEDEISKCRARMKELGITPATYASDKGHAAHFLSSEQILRLNKEYDEALLYHLTEEEAAAELGVPKDAVAGLIKNNDLLVERRTNPRAKSRKPIIYINPDQLDILKEDPYVRAKPAPIASATKGHIMRTHSIDEKTFNRATEELGIVPKPYRAAQGQIVVQDYYTSSETQRIVRYVKGGKSNSDVSKK